MTPMNTGAVHTIRFEDPRVVITCTREQGLLTRVSFEHFYTRG